jgi:hypothetical protein
MLKTLIKNKRGLVRFTLIIPILLVAFISIVHVISWYELANPLKWAIYLSIAIEVAAMTAIAASSVKIKGYSIWIIFVIVTFIQFIGNIFFCYTYIDISSKLFLDWVELTSPIFELLGGDSLDILSQKRVLALLEGGLLPIISLTSLHFFIKYGDLDEVNTQNSNYKNKEVLTEDIEKNIIKEDILIPENSEFEEIKENDVDSIVNDEKKISEPSQNQKINKEKDLSNLIENTQKKNLI